MRNWKDVMSNHTTQLLAPSEDDPDENRCRWAEEILEETQPYGSNAEPEDLENDESDPSASYSGDSHSAGSHSAGSRPEKTDLFGQLFEDRYYAEKARRQARRKQLRLLRRAYRGGKSLEQEKRDALRRMRSERTITAVDLRRRTADIFAAIERNEELLISYRDRYVALITPIDLLWPPNVRQAGVDQGGVTAQPGAGQPGTEQPGQSGPPPIERSRYFGCAKIMPKLRPRILWWGKQRPAAATPDGADSADGTSTADGTRRSDGTSTPDGADSAEQTETTGPEDDWSAWLSN